MSSFAGKVPHSVKLTKWDYYYTKEAPVPLASCSSCPFSILNFMLIDPLLYKNWLYHIHVIVNNILFRLLPVFELSVHTSILDGFTDQNLLILFNSGFIDMGMLMSVVLYIFSAE